jgi:hypothetical protein
MKKVGFIVEGQTEFILLKSQSFKEYLFSLNIEIAFDIIDAGGCNNLLPHNIEPNVKKLEDNGAEAIIILTDLDDAACITLTKNRIQTKDDYIVIIAVKQIESWFLANTQTMRLLLNQANYHFEFPEAEENPYKTIYQYLVDGRKGSYNKKRIVTSLLNLGFSIQDAATHPNCPSAKYFINKLTLLSAN